MAEKLPTAHFTDKYILSPTNPVTVTLVGAGGTGSQVLTSLARINISLIALGHPGIYVTVMDDDKITKANCGRQLFTEQEIGLHKAFILVSRVNRFFGTDWKGIAEKVTYKKVNVFQGSNIIISCVDSVPARFDLAKMLSWKGKHSNYRDKPIYWMDFGNSRDSGQVLLSTVSPVNQPDSTKFATAASLPKVTVEFKDLLKASIEDNSPSCSMVEALSKQDLFINTSISALGSSILWKLFSEGYIVHRGFFLNLSTMRTEPIAV